MQRGATLRMPKDCLSDVTLTSFYYRGVIIRVARFSADSEMSEIYDSKCSIEIMRTPAFGELRLGILAV